MVSAEQQHSARAHAARLDAAERRPRGALRAARSGASERSGKSRGADRGRDPKDHARNKLYPVLIGAEVLGRIV